MGATKSQREEMAGTKEEMKGTREEMAGTKEEMKGTREEMAGTKVAGVITEVHTRCKAS